MAGYIGISNLRVVEFMCRNIMLIIRKWSNSNNNSKNRIVTNVVNGITFKRMIYRY